MRPLLLAILAALLFGASTPASKALLQDFSPFQLAGFLYLGAAVIVAPMAISQGRHRSKRVLDHRNLARLVATMFFGGIVGPLLLLFALRAASSASVALLLNLELVATAILGVLFFREHLGFTGWLGVTASVGASAVLSLEGGFPGFWAALFVAGACVAWGIDNHLTALIDALSPTEMTLWKVLVAGAANLGLGLFLAPLPEYRLSIVWALGVGALSYGASILLYITAAQHLGATRAQSVFSSAPFLGTGLSFLFLGEAFYWEHLAAGGLLVLGVALLLRDRHGHEHNHEAEEHVHSHRHDDGHHDHEHPGLPASTTHAHLHRHQRIVHSHPHLPDLHHRHEH